MNTGSERVKLLKCTYSEDELKRRMNRQFAKDPMSWNDIKKIIDEERFDLLSRSKLQEVEYQSHCIELKCKWKSVSDYMLVRVFNFDCVLDESSGRYSANPDVINKGEEQTRLMLNDFPYHFVSGIQHWCLWKLNGYVNDNEILAAKRTILSARRTPTVDESHSVPVLMFENDSKVIYWKNPSHLKSIPDIDHVHILSQIK